MKVDRYGKKFAWIAYFELVFVKGTPVDIIEAEFKDRIIGTDGVKTLSRFDPLSFDTASRELIVSFDVKTINGNTITINEVLI